MTTYTVRKDGSGTHTTIQGAIYDASSGDIIDIEAGTFNENIEIYKNVKLHGAGKTLTSIVGKLSNDVVTGCSFFGGENVITMPSTSLMIKGRRVTGTSIAAGTRVAEIISATQIQISVSTATTGNITKTGVTWSSGSSTITLPSTTAVVVGMKVEGTGVSAIVTAYNTSTRVVTLSTPTTASGSADTLLFRKYNSGISVTMPAFFSGSSIPATIQFMNVATDGVELKNMKITGFDNSTPTVEASAIGFTSPTSGVHANWLIDGCEVVADGDSALLSAPNLASNNGTIQNSVFSGKTFSGSEPADVPAFSSFNKEGVISAVTASNFTVTYSDMKAIVVGGMATHSSYTGNATIASISGNNATYTKASTTFTVGQSITMTITNVQFTVANVARQLICLGNSSSVSACLNMTFKNNSVIGQSGAVISSSGNKAMFNTAVSIDTVGGLIEDNVIDGIFGAGQPNSIMANFAIRSRGTGVIVQNNTNMTTGGRGNSEFYIPNGTSINNITISQGLVSPSQPAAGQPIAISAEKNQLKSISKVSSDPIFSDEANWHLVSFIYKHDSSSRRLYTAFNDLSVSRNMKLRSGMMSGDNFQLHKIIISTSDRTLLVLKRDEISNASSYDFTLA